MRMFGYVATLMGKKLRVSGTNVPLKPGNRRVKASDA